MKKTATDLARECAVRFACAHIDGTEADDMVEIVVCGIEVDLCYSCWEDDENAQRIRGEIHAIRADLKKWAQVIS